MIKIGNSKIECVQIVQTVQPLRSVQNVFGKDWDRQTSVFERLEPSKALERNEVIERLEPDCDSLKGLNLWVKSKRIVYGGI